MKYECRIESFQSRIKSEVLKISFNCFITLYTNENIFIKFSLRVPCRSERGWGEAKK